MKLRAAVGMAALGVSCTIWAQDSYAGQIEKWRRQRAASLQRPDGWLAVAGLFWLHEGDNRCGSDPAAEVVLPAGRAPKSLGVFELQGNRTFFRPAGGAAGLALNGQPLDGRVPLRADVEGRPDLIQFGEFTMLVIRRGPKAGIRLRDTQSEMRRNFRGLEWFPVREEYRVVADWVPHPQPRTLAVPNILGQTERLPSPGYAVFQWQGAEYRLHPTQEGDQLFFVFRDRTAGKSTYGAGRFLYAALPVNGKVTLDFNKAYNPPCAFTPYATCPLPPKENRIDAFLEAGEKKYGNDH